MLCLRISLIGSLAGPVSGLCKILWHAPRVGVHHSKKLLREGEALTPAGETCSSLCVVQRRPSAAGIHLAKGELRKGDPRVPWPGDARAASRLNNRRADTPPCRQRVSLFLYLFVLQSQSGQPQQRRARAVRVSRRQRVLATKPRNHPVNVSTYGLALKEPWLRIFAMRGSLTNVRRLTRSSRSSVTLKKNRSATTVALMTRGSHGSSSCAVETDEGPRRWRYRASGPGRPAKFLTYRM